MISYTTQYANSLNQKFLDMINNVNEKQTGHNIFSMIYTVKMNQPYP